MIPCYICGLHAKWMVEDVIEGKQRAACREHVAHALYSRLSMVIEMEENGPEMKRKKEVLRNEFAES